MSKIATSFGSNVRRFRKAQDLTQKQLAEKTGISKETMSNIEMGKKWVSTKTVAKLAQVLGVEEEELFQNPASGSWNEMVTRISRLLTQVPADILCSLSETSDWTYVRKCFQPLNPSNLILPKIPCTWGPKKEADRRHDRISA